MLSDCQKFEPVNGISWSPRKIMVKDLRQRSGLAWFCTCAESCVVFTKGPYTVVPENSILITSNMQSETGFPSSHQLKSYIASESRLKLAARCPVSGCWPSCMKHRVLIVLLTCSHGNLPFLQLNSNNSYSLNFGNIIWQNMNNYLAYYSVQIEYSGQPE